MCNVCRNIQNWCFWSFFRFLTRFWRLRRSGNSCLTEIAAFEATHPTKIELKIEKMIRNTNSGYFGTHYTYRHVLWPRGLSQFRLSFSEKKPQFVASSKMGDQIAKEHLVYFTNEIGGFIGFWQSVCMRFDPELVRASPGGKLLYGMHLDSSTSPLMRFRVEQPKFWDTFWDNPYWFTVTSIGKFSKLSQLWDTISPSSSRVRSSDYNQTKGLDLILKNNLKFWKNIVSQKSWVVSKLSH